MSSSGGLTMAAEIVKDILNINNENDAKKYCNSDTTCKGYIANSANYMFIVTKKPVKNEDANGNYIRKKLSDPEAERQVSNMEIQAEAERLRQKAAIAERARLRSIAENKYNNSTDIAPECKEIASYNYRSMKESCSNGKVTQVMCAKTCAKIELDKFN